MAKVASLSICLMSAIYCAQNKYSIFWANLPSTFNRLCWKYFLIAALLSYVHYGAHHHHMGKCLERLGLQSLWLTSSCSSTSSVSSSSLSVLMVSTFVDSICVVHNCWLSTVCSLSVLVFSFCSGWSSTSSSVTGIWLSFSSIWNGQFFSSNVIVPVFIQFYICIMGIVFFQPCDSTSDMISTDCVIHVLTFVLKLTF